MNIGDIQKDCKQRMQKTVNTLGLVFTKIRAGRANPSLLDHISVEYYNNLTPINQVASINTEDSSTLKITPWDKNMVSVIEKAIIASDLGLNPNTKGQVIRVTLPPLTAERRLELVRIIKNEAENSKISIRNIRRDSNNNIKKLLKDKEISEDTARDTEIDIQNITNNFIINIDALCNEKEKSLTEL